jgi:FixJ family two-component response regulator
LLGIASSYAKDQFRAATRRVTVTGAMALTRIALVDDEASVRAALGRLLRLADYEVLSYASGEEFLAAIGDSMPDCALLDVHLPGLTGIEVQMRLQSDPVPLPVVFITASEDPAIARAALSAGGLRVLQKPFSSQELLASIDFALQTAVHPPR